jgi:glycosyltransferase involved in cell wall biosynthesis
VRHIPWSMENYTKELSKSDIGIVPNNLIPNKKIPQKFMENNKFNYSIDDFCLRFKMPSNPGRFIVFGKLNIPVVADFYPSSIQILGQENGYVAHSTHAWYYYLEKLILSHELRQQMGNRLQNLVLEKFDFKVQNQKMISFLKKQI